jgi:hypothetical protein
VFQLAHECVHLLSPSGGNNALRIEEGFATWFADKAASEHVGFHNVKHIASYAAARADVEVLLERDLLAIKLIRETQPILWELTPADILAALPDTDAALAERLCERFERGA